MQTSFGMALQRLHHPGQHPGRLHNEQHPAASSLLEKLLFAVIEVTDANPPRSRKPHPGCSPHGRLHNEQHPCRLPPAAWFEWGAQWLVYSIDAPIWQALAAAT